jgi:hypothetical protein
VFLQILFAFLGSVFALPFVVLGAIGGVEGIIDVLFSGLGPFAFMFGFLALSLGAFFMVAVLTSGWALVNRPFEIDTETGTTTDVHGRQWVRARHGPAKAMFTQVGPAAIIFPAFDILEDKAAAPAPPQRAGRTRRLLQRSFARLLLGAPGAEIDGLILPVGFLSDRKAIMAAIQPVPPPFRWF